MSSSFFLSISLLLRYFLSVRIFRIPSLFSTPFLPSKTNGIYYITVYLDSPTFGVERSRKQGHSD